MNFYFLFLCLCDSSIFFLLSLFIILCLSLCVRVGFISLFSFCLSILVFMCVCPYKGHLKCNMYLSSFSLFVLCLFLFFLFYSFIFSSLSRLDNYNPNFAMKYDKKLKKILVFRMFWQICVFVVFLTMQHG